MLGLVLVAAILGELPLMQSFAQFINQYEFWLTVVTGGIGALGFLLFMGGLLDLIMTQGEPMSHEDVEDLSRRVQQAARPATWRASTYRIWGKTAGAEAYDVFSLRAMKEAWRNGMWRHETVWRRRFVTAVGGVMTVAGLFGFLFVLGPPSIKILTSGALLYALGRTAWSFRQV